MLIIIQVTGKKQPVVAEICIINPRYWLGPTSVHSKSAGESPSAEQPPPLSHHITEACPFK